MANSLTAQNKKYDPWSTEQISLFQDFLCNSSEERDALSNTIEFWDALPKYSVNRRKMNTLRTDGGYLESFTAQFQIRGQDFSLRIIPAIVRDLKTGEEKAYYPSHDEELIEDALRKISTNKNMGFFDSEKTQCGVSFTLYQLRKELAERRHSRSLYEIIKSLYILSGSHIEIRRVGQGSREYIAKSNYIQSLTIVSERDMRRNKCRVVFHPLVSESLNTLAYRQFNYSSMMGLSTQIARWLHKKLAYEYTNASMTVPYYIKLSQVERDSLLLEYSRKNKRVERMDSALIELSTENNNHQRVLTSYNKVVHRGPRNSIVDVEYTLMPHPDFVKAVKAANKRKLNHSAIDIEKENGPRHSSVRSGTAKRSPPARRP